MSYWGNHECFDHLPDRDPTAPPDESDPLAYPEVNQAEDEWWNLPPTVLMTDAEIRAALAAAPECPPPTEHETELMEAYYARHWRWDQPF